MAKKNKGAGNALVQGSILAIASIISRIIGLIYRIPMQNILGDIGIGYYSTAFEIYNVMLIISSLLKAFISPSSLCQRWFRHRWQRKTEDRLIRF